MQLHYENYATTTHDKMANDPLSTESILKHMADAIPTHAKGDTGSDVSSSLDAISLFAHSCMAAVGFRLLGFGEGQKNGKLFIHRVRLELISAQNQN